MTILIYIGKLCLISGVLYGYYHFFLHNKRFHQYNRFYLLLIAAAAFIVPLLHIPVSFPANRGTGGLLRTFRVISAADWEDPVVIYANSNSLRRLVTVSNGFWLVYVAGLVIGVMALLRSLAYISRLRQTNPCQTIEQLKLYQTTAPGTPFSFFRSIFWDKFIRLEDPRGEQIFKHEMFHVKQQHSADILFMEMLCCIAWFNPFLHLIKKELRAIHEFLADEYAMSGNNHFEYAELLLLRAMQQQSPSITNSFFHNQIKRRINMITQSNLIRRSGYISRLMALPLLLILVSAFAVKLTAKSPRKTAGAYASKTLTVVIDAGHGGIFPGGQNHNGMMEKDITLGMAQKIKALSKEYNVNIILTRNNDALVGNASNLQEDLQNRVMLAASAKPDLFISIHANATDEKTTSLTGFDAYISGRNTHTGDRELATVLLTSLKEIYTVNETIHQRQTGIVVLDKSVCPAVCLECGYITNPDDVAFITNPVSQEKIARKVLEGIVRYGNLQSPGYIASADTISAEAIGKIEAADIKTVSVFTKQNFALIILKNGEQKLVNLKQLQDYYKAHPENDPGDAGKVTVVADSVTLVKTSTDTIPTKDTHGKNLVFTKVENEAEYPGGQQGWRDYLFKTLRYPQVAIDKEIQGTVVVQFIVDTNGKISDIKVLGGPKQLQAESIRVIRESGNWISAVQDGKKVKSYKKQPITYKMEIQGKS